MLLWTQIAEFRFGEKKIKIALMPLQKINTKKGSITPFPRII